MSRTERETTEQQMEKDEIDHERKVRNGKRERCREERNQYGEIIAISC